MSNEINSENLKKDYYYYIIQKLNITVIWQFQVMLSITMDFMNKTRHVITGWFNPKTRVLWSLRKENTYSKMNDMYKNKIFAYLLVRLELNWSLFACLIENFKLKKCRRKIIFKKGKETEQTFPYTYILLSFRSKYQPVSGWWCKV